MDDTEYSAAHVPAEDQAAEGDAAEPTIVEEAGTPPTVEVPLLIGKDAFQASATLAASGLTLGDQKEVPSETVPEGEIIVQVPKAGTEVGPDSLVSVAVSKGPATVRVPDLASLDRSEASRILAEVGLKLDDKIKTLNHETAEGQIIEQDPPAETEVKKVNSVHITVSSGPEKSFIAPYRSIRAGVRGSAGRSNWSPLRLRSS